MSQKGNGPKCGDDLGLGTKGRYGSLHFERVIDDVKCILVSRVCVCVCAWMCHLQLVRVLVPRRIPTLLHRPGCNLAEWEGMPTSCALLGGFAVGAFVSLL